MLEMLGHFQLDFSLHDFFHNFFRVVLATTEPIDGFDHLPIRGMFVAKGLGTRIIDKRLSSLSFCHAHMEVRLFIYAFILPPFFAFLHA